MPVAVNQPQRRQEKDPLDTIIKGLSVASSIYGIKEGMDKAELLKQQAAAQKQQQEMAAFEKGVVQDENGEFQYTPERQAERQAESALKAAQTKKALAEADQMPESRGLAQLIKAQQAQLQGLQIQEHQKKAGEIEGPKAMAATYGRRMEQADSVIADLANKGFDRTSTFAALEARVPGAIQGSEIKQQQQAEKNFVNAILRRESGAAISPTEFASAEEQYFPRAGDSPEVLAQKAQNRAQAIMGMRAEAGRAWEKVPLAATPQLRAKKASGSALTLPSGNAAPIPRGSPAPHPQDSEALKWAKQNPSDPRAQAIIKLNGR